MGDEWTTIPQEVGEATIAAVSGLISRPACKAKLLCKPPYRFVHDVVSAIQKETGFGAGLFDETESDSKCRDPQVKSSFLQKVIDLVGISLGEVVDVRVKKIMSGQEPECTNMLLQKLVQAATDDRVDRESAVNRVLDGEHQGEGPAARSAGADDGGGGAEEKGDADLPPTFEDEGKTSDDADAEEQKDAGDALPPSASVDPSQFTENWEDTNAAMGKLIKRPKMAEKLLKKPPFRFLHDVVTNLTSATGFGEGLVSGEMLDAKSEFMKLKENKIDFLTKVVDLTRVHLNMEVDIRPAKVVAGLEPECTVRWLQMLAYAASNGVDSAPSVERVLAGDTAVSAGNPGAESAAAGSGPPRQSPPRDPSPQKGPSPAKPPADEPPADAGDFSDVQAPPPSADFGEAKSDEPSFAPPTSASTSMKDGEEKRPEPTERPAGERAGGGRPSTARRGPKKLKQNVIRTNDKPSAPGTGPSTAGILGADDEESDDEATAEDDGDAESKNGDLVGQSKLVQDILKGVEDDKGSKASANAEQKEEKSGKGGIRINRRIAQRRGDEKSSIRYANVDIAKLRRAIQALCQSTNPLGKCMDYVHEDMDTMARELDHWRQENRRNVDVLDEEQKATAEELSPVRQELDAVTEEIEEQSSKINLVKARIAKNEQRMRELLGMVIN